MNGTRSTSGDLDEALAGLRHSSVSGRDRVHEKRAIAAQLFGDNAPAARRIGRFTVVRSIGRGAMGEVFAARDLELDRLVAIKVMTHRGSAAASERFLREGRALAKLSHTNIVQIHEVGEHDGTMFIAMEHVAGKTLRTWLREDAPDKGWAEIVEVFLAAGTGLEAAHAAGLVHRDFKPDNVMIGEDGRVRVLDFGLARNIDAVDFDLDAATTDQSKAATTDQSKAAESRTSDVRVTETGAALGTPAYMAPEQHRAEQATAASDQFGFCVALFEALFGVRPFAGDTRRELLEAIDGGQIARPLHRRRVPRRIHKAVVRGLRPRGEDRWPSMGELHAALRRSAIPPRRTRLLGTLALLGLSGGMFGAFTLYRGSKAKPVCESASERLAGVWDAGERDRVRGAILATRLPFAAGTWARVEPGLDAYAEAWAGGYRDACEATQVHQIQSAAAMDLRMTCLDRRRTELDAVVEALATTDSSSLARAVDLVLELPRIERCAELDRLREDLPPPDDPLIAEEVERIRGRLAAVRAVFRAGRVAEIANEAQELTYAARRSTYGPVWAEALTFHGEVLDAEADYPGAEAQLDRAFMLASEHGHVAVQAEAAQLLARIVGERQGHVVSGRAWAKTARALAIRPGADKETEARALTSFAAVEQLAGEMGAGFEESGRALALRKEAHGLDDLRVGESMGNHARATYNLQLRPELLAYMRIPEAASVQIDSLHQRRNVTAVRLLEGAIEIIEANLGPEHPRLVVELTSLALILDEVGEHEQALDNQQRAVDLAERTLPDDHPDRATALLGLGALLYARGEFVEALALFDQARTILERRLSPENPAISNPVLRRCMALIRLDRLDEAREACEQTLSLREGSYGIEHAGTATPAVLLGVILARQGELAKARLLLDRGRANLGRHLGYGHRSLLVPVMALAELELLDGHPDVALEYANEALRVSEASLAFVSPGQARFLRARALAADPALRDTALEVAHEAREELVLDGRYPEDLSQVDAWLATHE